MKKKTTRKQQKQENNAALPRGLRPAAEYYYRDTIRRQDATGYYSEADEDIRIRYANECVELERLEAIVDERGPDALIQITSTGYEQRSALASLLQSCKDNLRAYQAQLMLTPYQRKKGNTQGVHKKPVEPKKRSIDDMLGE